MTRREQLYYIDEEGFAVEIGDEVDFELQTDNCGMMEFRGEVTAISPRSRQVRVQFADTTDFARTTGEPRVKSRRVPITEVSLIARGS